MWHHIQQCDWYGSRDVCGSQAQLRPAGHKLRQREHCLHECTASGTQGGAAAQVKGKKKKAAWDGDSDPDSAGDLSGGEEYVIKVRRC